MSMRRQPSDELAGIEHNLLGYTDTSNIIVGVEQCARLAQECDGLDAITREEIRGRIIVMLNRLHANDTMCREALTGVLDALK